MNNFPNFFPQKIMYSFKSELSLSLKFVEEIILVGFIICLYRLFILRHALD